MPSQNEAIEELQAIATELDHKKAPLAALERQEYQARIKSSLGENNVNLKLLDVPSLAILFINQFFDAIPVDTFRNDLSSDKSKTFIQYMLEQYMPAQYTQEYQKLFPVDYLDSPTDECVLKQVPDDNLYKLFNQGLLRLRYVTKMLPGKKSALLQKIIQNKRVEQDSDSPHLHNLYELIVSSNSEVIGVLGDDDLIWLAERKLIGARNFTWLGPIRRAALFKKLATSSPELYQALVSASEPGEIAQLPIEQKINLINAGLFTRNHMNAHSDFEQAELITKFIGHVESAPSPTAATHIRLSNLLQWSEPDVSSRI